jgi:protein TonB
MFEAGLIESRHAIETKTRWTLMVSVMVQGGLLAVLIALPLLHPAMLHLDTARPIPMPVFMQPKPLPRQAVRAAASAAGPSMTRQIEIATNVEQRIHYSTASTAELPTAVTIGPMAQTGAPSLDLGGGSGTKVGGPGDSGTHGSIRLSQGVMEGHLIEPITTAYPRIAIAMGAEGKVVVAARISATGTIVDAHVVSGPVVLWNAALDAVKRARYEPYKLSGQAVEVETTVTIVFRLGS